MKNPSPMTNQFAQAPNVSVQRSVFNRPFSHKTTFDAGLLVPILVEEILPGDSLKCSASLLARLATPIYPVMDNVYIDTHFFFVPNRLVWDNWERFNGAQDNPGDSTDFLVPEVPGNFMSKWTPLTLGDYFGIPTDVAINVNALPFRAYNLIYNEWFRDQNLQDSVPLSVDDGPDNPADYVLRRRGKRHDYFTSCLPWPQKGASVQMPIGDTAPVVGDGTTLGLMTQSGSYYGLGAGTGGTGNLRTSNYNQTLPQADGGTLLQGSAVGVTDEPDKSGMFADLSSATAATINQLRLAFQTQRLLERDARSGTRHVEFLKAHFGVTSPDFRLQRPEYLGGGSQPLNFNSVAATTAVGTAAGEKVGDLAAFGTSVGRHGFSKSFVEHGYIIGLVSARADLTYQRGLHKMWSRRTRFDFAYPVLAHIGEQAVLNSEIFFQGTSADDDVFGYQERYAEYRYAISKITGLFRSVHPLSLDAWHLSQDFDTLPVLSDAFIQDNPPIDRVIRVPSQPHFILDAYFNLRHARPLPVRSVPGMMDHF